MDLRMNLIAELGLAAAMVTPMFVVLFIVLFAAPKYAKQKPYLQRVAKKYSIPPLNLR
jgi:hypothetical protein